jgi:hypothetical protein
MSFCETNRIAGDIVFSVTVRISDSCSDTLGNLNPVRLGRPTGFSLPSFRVPDGGSYGWALDTLASGDIVKLESDKNCRI